MAENCRFSVIAAIRMRWPAIAAAADVFMSGNVQPRKALEVLLGMRLPEQVIIAGRERGAIP